jgi:uncharacterized protein YndB with AHSA1/START domain
MSTDTRETATSVRSSVVVEVPVERAFRTFIEQFGEIKPPEHNMLGVQLVETVIQPRVGGHVIDRGVDGSEFPWARVLAYEPPNRLMISWDFTPQWEIQTEKTSEVDIRFISDTPDRTRVELEHRGLDRHGEGWEGMREAVQGDNGWPLYLHRYADLIGRQA